jgi:hypothetical protein
LSRDLKRGAEPAIPPGMKMHLEESRKRLLEGGVTQEMLDEVFRSNDAYFFVREMLATALLFPHRDDGWFKRRRLKKTLAGNWHAPADHLERCPPCRAWATDILVHLARLIEKPPSK